MRHFPALLALALLCVFFLNHRAFADTDADLTIGHVKTAAGSATIMRDGHAFPAVPGEPLRRADLLETGANGSLGIMLNDETRLSLGPTSRLSLEKFAFKPETEEYSLVTRITRGTLLMVSGLVAKLSPESARVETPSGIIGVRGTRFLVRVQE
jgi:hypothetical protein